MCGKQMVNDCIGIKDSKDEYKSILCVLSLVSLSANSVCLKDNWFALFLGEPVADIFELAIDFGQEQKRWPSGGIFIRVIVVVSLLLRVNISIFIISLPLLLAVRNAYVISLNQLNCECIRKSLHRIWIWLEYGWDLLE